MRKWQSVIALCLVMLLSGCGMEDELPQYIVKHDEGIAPWSLQDTATTSTQSVLERGQGIILEFADLELEADILGIYEISEEAEGEHQTATSLLVAGKEYEVDARILLSAEAEAILGQELDFLLACPTVVEKNKKSVFEVKVFANGALVLANEFAATATAHDLRVEYVPETYALTRNGEVSVELAAGDMIWNEDAESQVQMLDYLTRVDQQLGVYEYRLSYRIRTEMLATQQETALAQAEDPIQVYLCGISHQYADDRDRTSALLALNDCLRDNYMMQESILCEGTAYLTAEVFLPDWAREYAEQYGLLVTWYNYDVPGCGIGVSLPAFPDNLGHAEASYENLELSPLAISRTEGDVTGALTPTPVTPLSIWTKKENEVFALESLILANMPSESVAEPRNERSAVTQLLGGEIIKQLPASNMFYIVVGADLICIEDVASTENP